MIKKNFLFVLFCLFSLVVNAQVIADGVYVIKSSINPNYVIDLNSSNIASCENIQCWESNNTNAQRWILERVEESNGNSYVPAPLYPQTPQSQIEKCTHCYGTGKCSTCHGRGLSPNTSRPQACGACGGNGRCTLCHGTGYF